MSFEYSNPYGLGPYSGADEVKQAFTDLGEVTGGYKSLADSYVQSAALGKPDRGHLFYSAIGYFRRNATTGKSIPAAGITRLDRDVAYGLQSGEDVADGILGSGGSFLESGQSKFYYGSHQGMPDSYGYFYPAAGGVVGSQPKRQHHVEEVQWQADVYAQCYGPVSAATSARRNMSIGLDVEGVSKLATTCVATGTAANGLYLAGSSIITQASIGGSGLIQYLNNYGYGAGCCQLGIRAVGGDYTWTDASVSFHYVLQIYLKVVEV